MWAHDRKQGMALINGYTAKGCRALPEEAGWEDDRGAGSTGAVATITALRADEEWALLPDASIGSVLAEELRNPPPGRLKPIPRVNR